MSAQAPPPSPQKSLTTKAVQGGAWIYGRNLVTSIINLGVMAILARTLSPVEFGLVALAQVILRFLAILASDGVGDYVIYDKEEGHEERAQAAFWMDLALSSGVTLLGIIAIPLITNFYSEPNLGNVLVVLLLRYPIDSMAAVPDALIKKTLNFQKLVIRDTFIEIASGVGSVILVLSGFGVWSLVLPGLLLSPIRVGMVFWMARWRPTLPLYMHLWGRVFRFSANIIGANLANNIATEGDTLIIGKTLGMQDLGLYNLAWQSANLVSRNISGVVGKLAMPTLSAVAKNTERLRQEYVRMLRLLASVSFPLLIGLFVVADLFVLSIYGPQWAIAILPLRILIIYALRQSVGSPASAIYNVVGRPDLGMKFSLGFIPFYLFSIWLGSYYGIVGVAVGVTFARTAFGLVQFWIGARLVDDKLTKQLKELIHPFAAACWMGVVVTMGRFLLAPIIPTQLILLVLLVMLGGLVYLGIIGFVYRSILSELIAVVEALSKPLGSRLRILARLA